MSKKSKKQEILDDVEDYLEEHLSEDPSPLEKMIQIPAKDIEALLVQHDTSNRAGMTSVCEEIRRMAQEQMPELFPRSTHNA